MRATSTPTQATHATSSPTDKSIVELTMGERYARRWRTTYGPLAPRHIVVRYCAPHPDRHRAHRRAHAPRAGQDERTELLRTRQGSLAAAQRLLTQRTLDRLGRRRRAPRLGVRRSA